AALELIGSHDIAVADLAYGANGIYGYFNKWQKSFDISYTNKNVEKCIEKGNFASGKATVFAKSQIETIQDQLVQYFQDIKAVRQKEEQNYMLISAMVPHLYKLSVLNELEKCLQEIRKEKNTVPISEFNKKIAEIVLHEPVPFIYERLGERYNHILIDEFQDTSTLQWNNLLPLVENSLAGGNFNMLVGDAKQAIYRWRGGDMEQILHLYKQDTTKLHHNKPYEPLVQERYYGINSSLQPADLSVNYRSRAEIINFNNKLFEFISQENPQYPMLQSIYDDKFKQSVPAGAEKAGGHIQVLFTYNDDSNYPFDLNHCSRTTELYEDYAHEPLLTYSESTLNMVLQLVRHVLEEGYEQKDIAILSRVNYNSRQIAAFLKEKKFDIISQDSLSLQFAEVVNFMIALFRVFNRHDDVLARSEALYLFYKVVLNQIPQNSEVQELADISNAPDNQPFFAKMAKKGFNLEEKETGNLSIYELTEKMIRIFNLLDKNNEAEYIFRFLDLVLEYSLKHSNNLNNFLAYWETNKEKLSINTPKNRNAITITSIHKAKGLAYPVVIVPFADWSTEPKRGQLLWGRLQHDEAPVPKLKTAVVNLSSKLETTVLQEQYAQEMEKTFIENLNMLYVAFTRPVDRLYIIGKMQDFNKGNYQKNVSYLLYRYLQHQDVWRDDQRCYQLSKGGLNQHAHRQQEDNQYPLETFSSSDWSSRLRLKQHANNVFDFDVQQEQRDWNKKVHYALSRINTYEDLDLTIRQLINEGVISQRDRAKLELTLNGILQHPDMYRYYSDDVVV
ncbi:MAG: UvrD-helicase domain-containing protein, partial [Hymenobacteraceae bacterium]|nr:UvrD-helicase domain-containing protein [Hymenobacteraceae bacterium]MDX5396583.1 UvrD-helicase domain-containing protein [Hymenobacteraceae bacterium]MDX5512646.1 UvrD-helicase domain-containing protein [Hymenobacteraceae bacterium]